MPLDYSKWDNLELSDDSDIEVHPNVDKRSMIKWKQEAIHRERAERKAKMEYIEKFIPQQQNVLKKIKELTHILQQGEDLAGVQSVVKALDQQQADADPGMMIPAPKNGQSGEMNVAQVFQAMKEQIATGLATTSPVEVKRTLLERFQQTECTVQKHIEDAGKELEKLNKEASKKLTSENMFKETANKTFLNKPKPLPKKTEKKKVVETLNPNAAMKDLILTDKGSEADDEEDFEDDDEDIDMSPEATTFSKLKGFEASYKYLNNHLSLINEKTSDSILGNAFTAQLKGQHDYAKNCVIQSLTIQYCGQLGKDGLNVFFSRMSAPNTQGRKMFFDDIEKTYGRIQSRCLEIAAETADEGESGEVEQIQLQPMGDGTQLTIRVPEPEDEEPYKVFKTMPENFQEALKTGTLDSLNKVLGKLSVADAEVLVKLCSDYGFLDVEGDIVDETQVAK